MGKIIRVGILCLGLLFHTTTKAQIYEWGYSLNSNFYKGDLNVELVSLDSYRPGISFFARKATNNDFIDLRFQASFGNFTGSDSKYANSEYLKIQDRAKRNLSFSTYFATFNTTVDVNLGDFQYYINRRLYTSRIYVFSGLGLTYFEPYTQFRGENVKLRSFQTEGVKYLPITYSIPFGVGFKAEVSNKGSIGIELCYNITGTDYLDDVSGYYPSLSKTLKDNGQKGALLSYRHLELDPNASFTKENIVKYNKSNKLRGNPDNKDGYYYVALTYSHKLKTKRKRRW